MRDLATTKFTPGPWHPGHLGSDSSCQCANVVDEGYAGGICTIHVDNGIRSIADGGNDAPPKEQAVANMHLIAAAPDLYAALEAMVSDRMNGPDSLPIWKQAEAALAKARGVQP